jgi:hypothetical protein
LSVDLSTYMCHELIAMAWTVAVRRAVSVCIAVYDLSKVCGRQAGVNMRVLLATTANAGHFMPMMPFAKACLRAGHEVRVAARPRSSAPVCCTGRAPTSIPVSGRNSAPFTGTCGVLVSPHDRGS